MHSMFRMWTGEPVVDIAFLSKLKRKRTDSPEPTSPRHQHLSKKWKLEPSEVSVPAQVAELHPDSHRDMESRCLPPDAADHSPACRPSVDASVNEAAGRLSGSEDVALADESRNAASAPSTALPENGAPSNVTSTTRDMADKIPALQDAIEAQFNYEILLKHEEMRLIETELAKCQIALEQLRRCQAIPFPGATGFSQDVSSGIGPSLEPAPGYSRPQYPAPWGAADGPYTRHYAKWLIPDPYFDSETGGWRSVRTRQTRAAPFEIASSPAPVEPPMIKRARLLRKSDNKVVDLHCETCQTSTFGNVQGFLNHMRIKHSLHFKDHEAAALSCGQIVEGDDVSLPVSTPTTAKPAVATRPTAGKKPAALQGLKHPRKALSKKAASQTIGTPKPVSAVTTPALNIGGSVHAYAKPDYFTPMSSAPLSYPSRARNTDYHADVSAASTPTSEAPLTPSARTPHLSALMQKRGFGGDLARLVEEVRRPINLQAVDPASDEEDAPTPTSQRSKSNSIAQPGNPPATRVPTSQSGTSKRDSGTSKPATDVSTFSSPKKRKLDPVRVPDDSLRRMSSLYGASTPDSVALQSAPSFAHKSSDLANLDLSPNTVESNPGLVSDHEDEDEEDDARSVAAPSLVRDGEFDEMEVEVEDGSDLESRKGLTIKAGSSRKRAKQERL